MIYKAAMISENVATMDSAMSLITSQYAAVILDSL